MIELKEYNEGGSLLTTFVQSDGRISEIKIRSNLSRVDIIAPQDKKSIFERWMGILLPAGFPNSVTEDYLAYKIYDASQAFSSTIAGLLANRAVLQGVGVGDASASPTAALLLTVFQESAGRIATILFAHKLGTSIEPECKTYRLAADIFNDAAMVADCLSPVFPKPVRVVIFSFSSVLRALCGVAAHSSKSTLTAHFAKQNNLGELNAKDASQGNAISLIGMLVGSLVVSRVTTPLAVWTSMLLLLTMHLSMNYAAVRAVSMRNLNRQRANILFSHLIAYDKVLTPREVAKRERIFERDGALRWANDREVGHGKIGVSIQDIVYYLSRDQQHPITKSSTQGPELGQLLEFYKDEEYILWYDWTTKTVSIVLKKGVSSRSQLKAWIQGLLIANETFERKLTNPDITQLMGFITASLEQVTKLFNERMEHITSAGWLIEIAALETQNRRRLVCIP